MEYVDMEELPSDESYDEAIIDIAQMRKNDCREYEMMLKVDDSMDIDYKTFLSGMLIGIPKAKSIENPTQNDNFDDDGDDFDAREVDKDIFPVEGEKDPNYESFLKRLTANGNSYMVKSQRSCSPLFIKYDLDESLDEEFDLDYKKKSRIFKEQDNQIPKKCGHKFPKSETAEETENSSRRQLRSERVEYVKDSSEEKIPDPDYATFRRGVQIVNGNMVYKYLAHTVVYELEDEEGACKIEYDDNDDWANEVEIIDYATFYKEGNSRHSMAGANNSSAFRRQLMDILRKPYDRKEYDKLWSDVKYCTTVMRHIDLRHGRERSHSTDKSGKSYLDYHPDLRRKLSNFQGDEPKRLNLLRGFFFWLEKSSLDKSFHPWLDEECLDIIPGSG